MKSNYKPIVRFFDFILVCSLMSSHDRHCRTDTIIEEINVNHLVPTAVVFFAACTLLSPEKCDGSSDRLPPNFIS